MKNKSYRINGRVIERQNRLGIAGLRVEAWDKDLIFDDLVGSVITSKDGEFQIEFDESYFSEIFFDRRPDLFFRVYFDDGLVLDTKNNILWNLKDKTKTVELLVEGELVGLPGSSDPVVVIPGMKLEELSDILTVDASVMQNLKEKNLEIEQVGEATLTTMVNDEIISPEQKQEIQLVIGLARISGENLELTQALKNDTQESPVELTRWNRADWLSFLQDNNIQLPDDESSLDSYAENLRNVVEKSFPNEYFLQRLVNEEVHEKTSGFVSAISPLFNNNEIIFTGDPDEKLDYDWTDISDNDKKNIQSGLAELAPLINTYRSLGLVEILNHPDKTAEQKKSAIENRFLSLSAFYSNNPAMDLNSADFSTRNSETNEDSWNWQGIDTQDQSHVKKQMAATQRVYNMSGNHETGDILLKKGYDSASAITSTTEDKFLDRSRLGWERGKKVYAKASEMAVASSHYFEAIRDVTRGDFGSIAVSNQDASLVNDLKEIDGYEELFGNQDFCDCEHCKSIFSPAAYFTDLMYFVSENVSKKLFTPSRTSHPLYLKRRRPDLWTLKLNCQNTKTEIPYLQVVNEVLEKYLAQETSSADVYEMLRTSDWSCRQPFNLSLEEIRLYLSHFDLSLAEIYKTLKQPEEQQYREQLLLSAEELQVIATSNPMGTHKRFGNITLASFEVQEFIHLAGINRSQLDDLLATKFAPSIALVKVQMVKSGVDIQQYAEKLTGLTDVNLDVIHRYLRLWKKTNWSLREFDLILCAMQSKGLIAGLEDLDGESQPKLLELGQVRSIQKRLVCTAEEMTAIIYRIPLIAVVDDQSALYQRIFDLEKIFGVENVDENSTATLFALSADDKITPLILAGLSITESELEMLFDFLDIDTSVDQELDIDLLSTLYRHALIARGLKLGIEELVHLISLVTGGGAITQLAQIKSLDDASQWCKTTRFSVSELLLIIKTEESSDLQFTNDIHLASSIIIEIQTNANADKIDKEVLLKTYLQSSFNLTAGQLDDEFIMHLLTLNLSSPSIMTALNATFTDGKPDNPGDLSGLLSLLEELERYTMLFEKAEFDAEMISFMIANKEVFGIVDLKALGIDQLINITRYQKLLEGGDKQRDALHFALQDIQSSGLISNEVTATFADAWMQPESLIASLSSSLSFSLPVIEAIAHLQNVLGICTRLGVQADALEKLANSDKEGLLAARNVVVGAFASKYPDEKIRNEKLQPYNDKLNTLKRDALCDYIISRSDIFKFNDRNDLYNFFLLDVEMSGCFRTSYLVAAISSLQLYVHRCLINLEQSDKNLNPDIDDVKVISSWIPADEWEWRKNYRVWEANRKVFLYPENYIAPSLRDNKTEIFKELEDELLQQDISKDSAEKAYKKYLAQFTQLTRLRYAGGYYHRVSNGMGMLGLVGVSVGAEQQQHEAYYYVDAIAFDGESEESKFYLFARTNVQPYQYSYRTYNHYKEVWTSWKTVDLGIEAAEISTIIYHGKLYIYWTEVQSKEVNKIEGGSSSSNGYVFKAYVKYSYLDENEKWSAPQRLYIGQNHVPEKTIFRRVWGGDFPSDSIREKAYESTVEKFQALVFRKPYATIVDNNEQPIALQHIWSHNKFGSKITYTTGNVSYKLNSLFSFKTFNVPSQDFVVIDDDFSQAFIECDATITFNNNVSSTRAYVRLLNSGRFKVRFPDYSFSLSHSVLSQHNELNTVIKTNATNLSLSRNSITNLQQGDMLSGAANISTTPAMEREYIEAFSENESLGFYIESGKKSLSQHFVYQTAANNAQLSVINDLVPLSTILMDELSDKLFAQGLEEFLLLSTQKLTDDGGQTFDFIGAYGEYYWELFFHIPFLIADHLNANQKFKEAKWWYERIFNPNAYEEPDNIDHNWQFREFRNLDIQKLKDILSDSQAIEAYKSDPFSPHAIARLRMGAYQKTIVMHYIDNLLDWGDYLFMQDTRESINEAEMLYQLAFDILGERPVKVGKCETADEDKLNYANIEPQIGKGSEFLIQLENYYWTQKQTYKYEKDLARISKRIESIAAEQSVAGKSFAEIQRKSAYTSAAAMIEQIEDMASNPQGQYAQTDSYAAHVKSYRKTKADKMAARENHTKWQDSEEYIFGNKSNSRFKTKKQTRTPGHEIVKQYSMVFCVPPNTDLMKYWDRVEDRLFKIRNCMNIKGIRRSLSLFQPPIDPMLLVRAKAAGLSLEDITAMISPAKLPAYRFTYLLEKAKQYTQTVQSFGSALLSALEKKDGEELILLRSVHEKNILKLTKAIKKKQLQDAQYQHKAAEAALVNVQNRIDYYQDLIDTGLTSWEETEQTSKWTASSIRITKAAMELMASVYGFLPQIGSPFAMKYGGQELKNGTKGLADATGAAAAIADNVAILAGLEASHQRRSQNWRHQLKLAQQEFKQSSIQLLASEMRQQIAEHDLDIHEKNIEQSDELFDFYKNKFTNLGLYNYMASTLNRLYRDAYNIAYDLAKQAEVAYQHERYDEEIYIQADNWQFDRAGLLSGEHLMMQLQGLEKNYIDGNERQPEITQTFSLAMLSAQQLLILRQTGSCDISIPEIAYEMLYPGQYRRTIKSVRISIPCVTGPYTNISARLTLTSGSIEREDDNILEDLPVAVNTSINSSSANNDSGVFDLNFRDERYLPFEGAGAISEWTLELPANIRAFNYDTISDVLLHISYTAYEGDRESAENALATLVNDYAANTGFYRLVSLRYEFPEALNKLFSEDNQVANFDLTSSHFPYLLSSKDLTMVTGCMVYVKPKTKMQALVPGIVKVNTTTVDWTDQTNNIPSGASVNGEDDRIKGGTVELTNSPVKTWEIDAGNLGIDKDSTEDVLVLIRYKTS